MVDMRILVIEDAQKAAEGATVSIRLPLAA
jgi:hypothetical protein